MKPHAAILAAVLLLAGCGDDDEPAVNRPNKAVEPATVGEPVMLRSGSGEPIRVVLQQVQDPIRSHPYEDARVSGRFVGVELRLTNRGDIPYRGSPWSGARLSTSKGAERPAKLLSQGSCLGTVRLAISPGAGTRLCIPFRVERGAKLLKFRFAPQAGFAPSAAVWDLRDRG